MEAKIFEDVSGSRIPDMTCIKCSALAPFNPMSKCPNCLEQEINIAQFIPDCVQIKTCRLCGRYLIQKNVWKNLRFGSVEHMEFLLKNCPGLDTVILNDAIFTKLEPDSKRCTVAIKVSREIFDSLTMQKAVQITFRNKNHTCQDCHRSEAKDFWRARIQIRQKVVHRRTFYYLEQLLMATKATHNILKSEKAVNGIDLMFSDRKYALKLAAFIQSKVPCRLTHSQTLVTEDVKNGTANIKYTICVEIAPVVKSSVVFLGKKLAEKYGNISQLCVCHKVNANIHVVDPLTRQVEAISASDFWHHPFAMLSDHKTLAKYVVIDIDKSIEMDYRVKKDKKVKKPSKKKCKTAPPQLPATKKAAVEEPPKIVSQTHHTSDHFTLADVTLQKITSDGNAELIQAKTHLGNLLHVGDVVLCYEFIQTHDEHALEYQERIPQKVIIAEKDESEKRRERKRLRAFKLKRMDIDDGEANEETGPSDNNPLSTIAENEYEQFLNDIEDDPEMREHIQLYRNQEKIDRLSKDDRQKMLKYYTDFQLTDMMNDMNL